MLLLPVQAHLLQRSRHWCAPKVHSLLGGFARLQAGSQRAWTFHAQLQHSTTAFLWAHQVSLQLLCCAA